MTLEVKTNSQGKFGKISTFIKTLSIFREKYTGLLGKMKDVDVLLSPLKDEQLVRDYENAKVALQKYVDLIQKCEAPERQELLWDVDYFREVRHDLRAAIGGIMGYVELIKDSLEDMNADKNIMEALQSLHSLASRVLPIIDGFVHDQPSMEKTENETNYKISILTGNILIVDDSEQKRDLLKRKLESIGHTVIMAKNGEEGLEKISVYAPDMVLLDLFMPKLNGDEVLKRMKADNHLKNIPVLMVSSSNDMDNVIKCIQLGADDYLSMPLNTTLLHARINACLTKKRARDREIQVSNELEQARIRLKTAIDNIDEGFAVFDENDKLIVHNQGFYNLYPGLWHFAGLSCTYEQLLRANIEQGVYQENRRGKKNDDSQLKTDDWIKLKMSYHRHPSRPQLDLLSSGKWVEVIENKIPGGGVVSIHKDISIAKKKEERLEYLALHDGLTGLSNRKKFDLTLSALCTSYQKKETGDFGVVFFDLDGFKNVNDTLGHDFGDFLLQTVAKKLTQSVREEDLVARFGGDEFAALITDLSSKDQIIQVAERCLKAIGKHVEKNGKIAKFGVSIGIALCPENGQDPEILLKKADTAMYDAKKSGKGTYRVAG